MSNRLSLGDLYKATTFRVEAPDGDIDIRIGEAHPLLDGLLSRHNATEWAYITAWNPESRPMSADQNALAQGRMLQILRDRHFVYYQGEGIPDQEGWASEGSVWIAGISRQEAVEIGRQFRQNAIVVGTLGGVAELVIRDV